MTQRVFWRVVCAIFALIAPFAISHPFGAFGLLLYPQRTVSDEILQALSEGKIRVKWD